MVDLSREAFEGMIRCNLKGKGIVAKLIATISIE
jgi:hypothetical protein